MSTDLELFAGAAYDPTTAGDLVAWQRPAGVALLATPQGATALPGRAPALAPDRVAWLEGDRIVVADTALSVLAAYDAPGAGAVALSAEWLVWRTRDAAGVDRLHATSTASGAASRTLARSRPSGELGRPSVAGGLLLYHEAGRRGSRLVAHDLASGRRTVLRREAGALLSNPATDGSRLLYVRATGHTQELRLGALRRGAPDRDSVVLVQPSPGQRDAEHERDRTRHSRRPLPPRARPGVADTLWTTALGPAYAYVTRLRTSRRAERSADILRVRVPPAG